MGIQHPFQCHDGFTGALAVQGSHTQQVVEVAAAGVGPGVGLQQPPRRLGLAGQQGTCPVEQGRQGGETAGQRCCTGGRVRRQGTTLAWDCGRDAGCGCADDRPGAGDDRRASGRHVPSCRHARSCTDVFAGGNGLSCGGRSAGRGGERPAGRCGKGERDTCQGNGQRDRVHESFEAGYAARGREISRAWISPRARRSAATRTSVRSTCSATGSPRRVWVYAETMSTSII